MPFFVRDDADTTDSNPVDKLQFKSEVNIEEMNNQHEKASGDVVAEPKELKQIVFREIVTIDHDYLERKRRYEQELAEGNPNAKPPEPSPEYLRQRAFLLGETAQETVQPSRSSNTLGNILYKDSGYPMPVYNLIEQDTSIVTDNQSTLSVQNAPPQLTKAIDARNTLPVQSIPQFSPRNMGQQSSGIIGAVQANQFIGSVKIGDHLSVRDDGYYFQNTDGQWIRFTDFVIIVDYLEECIGIDGSISRKFAIRLRNDCGRQKPLAVEYESWTNLQNQIERQAPEFQIFTDEQRNVREKFKRLLGEILKHTQILKKIVYNYWGWGQPLNGTRRFFHGGLPDCNSEKQMPPPLADEIQHNFIIASAWNILNVGSLEVTVPVVCYALASYVDALFTDAGYPLAHCLMIIGESGTLKTSFSKVVFAPFNSENDRVHTVRSTEASLRVLHEKCYDDTLVVDDFNLEGSQQEVNEKMRNIRALIRTYSDKTPRAKYGGKDNVKKYAVRGGCVFTGETKLIGQLQSSELRYLKVKIKERLNGNALLIFQQYPYIWSYFVATFIRHLENNYDKIVWKIKQTFANERAIQGFKNLRMVDSFLHLKIVAEIFCNVFYEANFFSKDAVEAQKKAVEAWKEAFEYFRKVLYQFISNQDKDAILQEPYKMYLAELFNLLDTGKLRLAPNIEIYMQNMQIYVGYRDMNDQILMIKKDEAFNAVQIAFRARNDYLPASADDISKVLRDEGLTKCDKGSCLKKAPSMIVGSPNVSSHPSKMCRASSKPVSIILGNHFWC